MPSRLSRVRGINFVPFLLLAIGTMTLADTRVGSWIARPLGGLFGLAGNVVGVSGALIATVVFVIIGVAALCDLSDLNPDGIAKTAVITLPFLALVAVGPFADAGAGLFDAVSNAGADALTTLVRG